MPILKSEREIGWPHCKSGQTTRNSGQKPSPFPLAKTKKRYTQKKDLKKPVKLHDNLDLALSKAPVFRQGLCGWHGREEPTILTFFHSSWRTKGRFIWERLAFSFLFSDFYYYYYFLFILGCGFLCGSSYYGSIWRVAILNIVYSNRILFSSLYPLPLLSLHTHTQILYLFIHAHTHTCVKGVCVSVCDLSW